MLGEICNSERLDNRLMDLFLKSNLLSLNDAKEAFLRRNRYGTALVDVLVKDNFINHEQVYKGLAKCHNVDYVDLKKHPPDKQIFHKRDFFNYVHFNFIPWREDEDILKVAVSFVSEDLLVFLKEKYPKGFKVVFTLPEYITLSIQRLCSGFALSMVKKEVSAVAPIYSSNYLLSLRQKNKILGLAFLLISFFVFFPKFVFVFLVLVSNLFFLSNVLFRVFLFASGVNSLRNHKKLEIKEKDLPIYTILLPLYKESSAIPKLLNSIRNINYPKSKLDVILIVEEFDKETISSIKRLKYGGLFRVICIPKSYPKTKPKACSYALKFAKGEYVTIFDAEDRPESDQLIKAIHHFRSSDDRVACVQARLFCINYKENLLSFLFSIEYFIWFGYLLRGLQKNRMPIPLGGTSNHFKTEVLRLSGAWDPYNVTEDADIGYRIAKYGYRTEIIDSITWEEAPISLTSWLNQRSRWIKGHVQTYIVHLRDSFRFSEYFGFMGILGFHAFLILPVLNYFFQGIIFLQLFLRGELFISGFLMYVSFINFSIWAVVSIFMAIFVCLKMRVNGVKFWYFLASPFYYILHFFSSLIAIYDIMFRAHYWAKTTHNFDQRAENEK